MVFYFSGTGNSLQAAKNIAQYNGEPLVSIAELMNSNEAVFDYELQCNETIGFVFPVYAWGPPLMVMEFIDKVNFKNFNNNYIYAVATCGENIGNTMKLLEKCLDKKRLGLSSGFSIKMPNNYVIMGDVDSKDIEKKKLQEAEKTLLDINKVIEKRQVGVFNIEKGFLGTILTGIVNPMFSKHALETSKFMTDSNCTGCGICEQVCNCNTIRLVDKRPQWGEKCSQCLACLHYCPVSAIQYGNGTRKKGRYTNPKV